MPVQYRKHGLSSRVIVPADLRPFLCRGEIVRSLETNKPAEAKRRLSLWENSLLVLFHTLRQDAHRMTTEQIERLIARHLGAKFEEIEERLAFDWSDEGARDTHHDALTDRAHVLSGMLSSFDYGEFQARADELFPQADDNTRRRLCRRLVEAELDAITAELRALGGEPLRVPEGVIREEPASLRVTKAAEQYAESKIAAGAWDAKTERTFRMVLQHMAELLGDPPLREVTKEAIRQYGLALPRLPSNALKIFGPVSAPEAIARADAATDRNYPRVAPRTINKHFQTVRSFFKWAEEHDLIPQNPASVLKDVEEGRAQDAREAFEDADLLKFFPYLEEKGTANELWIARILAYSGMRLGEVAQLHAEDLRTVDGVLVFDVNERNGKKVKTNSSVRLVPLHPRLVEMGLPELVQGVGKGPLWPELWKHKMAAEYGPGHNLSQVLMRRLRASGVTDKLKVLHSFRHTVATRLKAAGAAEYQIAEILGHENASITTGRYGKAIGVTQLLSALRQLALPL